MRAIAVMAAIVWAGCGPAPAKPRAAAPAAGAGSNVAAAAGSGSGSSAPEAPASKDVLPGAVERVVQLFEAIAALPPAASCEADAAAIAKARAPYADAIAVVARARTTEPAAVRPIVATHRARLVAIWPKLQRPACAGVELDLLEGP